MRWISHVRQLGLGLLAAGLACTYGSLPSLAMAPSLAIAGAPRPELQADDRPATQDQIDAAIEAGVRFILSRQQLDGSWRADEHRYVAGQTGLCVYTLLKGGLKSSHPAVERGIAFIRAHPPQWTYGISCCLLALQTADPERYGDDIAALTDVLLECHGQGFSYPGGHEDLSLTQYGCLGLRAAEAAGVEVPARVWEDTLDFAFNVHADSGAFTYKQGTEQTGSMTAAGIAVMQICKDALVAKKKLSNREQRFVNEAIEAGVVWLGEHFRVDRNPDPASKNDNAGHMTRWQLYYLYGLERVGGLTGRSKYGPHDWYARASTALVKSQSDKGAWTTPHGEPHPGTCFGVLVLKRATAPSSGKAPRAPQSYGDDDAARPLSLRVTGDNPLTAWVSSWGDATLEKHEWDRERTKGPRVWRVEYVNVESGEVLFRADGNGDKPAKGARFAARIRVPKPGTYKIMARAFLRPIDDETGEEVQVDSQTLTVRVDGVMTAAMREATLDLTRNVLSATRTDATASSTVNSGHGPRFAVDGNLGYGWLSKPDDAEPWLLVEPARPQRADTIALSPHYRAPNEPGVWGRAKRVFVRVNGKKVGEFEIDADPFAKTYIPLKSRTSVRKVKIEVLERIDGTDGANGKSVGFAEVELQLRGKR